MAKTLDLKSWGIEGLTVGQPVTLYHGTTRSFTAFDLSRSRTELVNSYYGAGIFLTPSKKVAVAYAHANRNIGFDPDIIAELKRHKPKAGAFLQSLYLHGKDAWEVLETDLREAYPGEQYPLNNASLYLGVDANSLSDLAPYIIGSRDKPHGGEASLFDQSTGAPSWVYDLLDEVGLDSSVYRPKVYACVVVVTNTLVTASRSAAKAAHNKGYDSVVYYGSGLVSGVPEVAVFDARNVHVQSVDVL